MRQGTAFRSLSQAVFADLRAQILAGKHAPGAKLSPRAIASASKVSLSVVREALARLAEQGLVVAEPQFGFTVVPLDIDDVRDITKLRVLIECATLRDAVEHADIEYEARVLASHHRLARTPPYEDECIGILTEEWARAHAQFHAALLSGSPSPRLRDLAATLRETAELYRRWSGCLSGQQARRDVPAEHRALMQAALDRDVDRAVALLTDHINTTALMLERYVEEHPLSRSAVEPVWAGDAAS
jgi:DNA-binding GntR family transcriptional regulator